MWKLNRIAVALSIAVTLLSGAGASAQVLERKSNKLYYCNQPIRLIGYGDYGMLAEPNFDYVAYIDKLVSKKVNFSRIWVIYHFAKGLTPFGGTFGNWDLTTWNEAFFLRLKNFVAYAESKGVIVQVNIFDSVHLEPSPLRWDRSPYNNKNNKQNYCNSGSDGDDMDGSPPIWQQVNKPLIGKVVSTLNGFGNVMYEVMNEPNGSYGDQAFLDAVIDELHALLNAPGHTGSKVISLNPRLGTSAGVNNPKVDVVSFHITKSTDAGNFGGFTKPTIVSNDGDPMSQSTQEGYSSAERIANVKLICNKVFGTEVGKMHVEILDKDINCDTWKTYDYDPSAACLSNGVLDALKSFAETPPNACGAAPVDPGNGGGGTVDPNCPVGQKVTVDNGATGSKTTASGTYTETTQNWEYRASLGQATGADYRYLSQYIGDKTRKGTAKWTPKLSRKGTYRVTATFRATGNRTKDADYYVYDANGVKSHFQVDQSQGLSGEASIGPIYSDLGTHYLEPGKGYVLLDGDDGKSDEADAVIFTLKSCGDGTICTPNCEGKPAGADDTCGKQCPGCIPNCKGKPPGSDDGCKSTCVICEPDCAGKNGGADGCGGTCPVCQPNCGGKKAGAADGCGGKCPEILLTCPAPPPGPQTVVVYATQATATGGWTAVARAEDKADGKFSHTQNLDKGENLTGTAFGACDPDGVEIITSVKVGVRSKVQYDSGKYKVIVKVGSSGKTKTYSHENLAWDELDITSAKASWTWNDVKALKVTVSLGSHPEGYRDSDVWVDAFRVTVGFTSCTPKVSKVCEGGNARWVDGCGGTAELAEACDDGNACTTDGCSAGACTHAVLPTPECIEAPVPVCTPKASKACFGASVFWVDSCGIATEVAESCNDGDPCTQDGCDVTTLSCTHTLLLTPGCGGCTPFASLGCLAGSQVWKDSCGNVDDIAGSCDDANPCTIDGCDDMTGACAHAPSTAPACVACEPDVAVACTPTGILRVDGCGGYGALVESCDDGDPCTVDGCDPNGVVCTHIPTGGPGCTPCVVDAVPTCFGNSLVFADSCGNVTKVVTHCSDGDECTVDTCNPTTRACEFVAASSPDCAGGCIPLAKRACVNGHVAWVDSCGNTGALAELCDDDDPCTVDLCDPASAVCTHVPSGALECAPCVDQGATGCFSGAIVSIDSCSNVIGVDQSCQDDDPCTVDACEPATKSCLHTPSGAAGCVKCEPNASTRCEANVLVNVDSCGNTLGLAQSCDDFDACTVDICNGGTNQCEHYPSPALECAPCEPNESLACVSGELVWFDSCGEQGAVASTCDDGDACTFDDCDPTANLCAHVPTTGPGCDGCGGDSGEGCFLGKRVAFDSCGVITATLDECVDGDPCTDDGCDGETVTCTHKPSNKPECLECKPKAEAACKGNDVIWLDSCGGEGDVITSCDDGDACTIDACDPTTAFCVHVPDGSCQTEEPCLATPIQICQDGALLWLDACGQLAGVADPCSDGEPCTIDGCDEETLSCTQTPSDSPDCTGEIPEPNGCDESAYLDCFAGGLVWVNACGQQKGVAKLCDDGDPCTVDGCDPAIVACTYSPSASADCGTPPTADDPDGDTSSGSDDLGTPTGDDDTGSIDDDLSGPVNGAELEGDTTDTTTPTGRPVKGGDGCTTRGASGSSPWAVLLVAVAALFAVQRRRSTRTTVRMTGMVVAATTLGLLEAPSARAAAPCGNVPASPWVKYASDCYETTNNGWDYETRAYGAPDGDGGTFCDACGKSGTGYTYLLSCGAWNYCDPPNVDTITSVKVAVYVKGATSNTMKLSVGSKSKNFTQGSTFGWEELDVTSLESTWTWDKVNALQAKVDWVSGTTTAQYAVNGFRVEVAFTNCTPNASTYCNGTEIRWKDSCGNDGGVKQSCDDGNGCTVDACVGGGSCSNAPVANTGTTCHNGNVHYTDSCGNIGGLVGSCDDGKPCTVDSCANSLCYHNAQPNTGQICHNGNVHYTDSCGAIGAMVKACDDGNGCTTDGCAGSSCYNNPTPDTQKVCFENDLYFADSCGNRAAKLAECDDGNLCTIDACDAAGGTCQHTEDEVICPKPCVDPPTAKCFDNNVILVDCKNNTVGTQSCDDGNLCTLDGCVEGVCKHDPVTTNCACNPALTTTCQANSLVELDACGNLETTLEDCDDGDPCTIDQCDEQAKLCQHTPKECPTDCKPDGFVCQGNKLFAIDTCKNLKEADDCDDGDACTIDACSEAACTHVPSNDPSCVCGDVVSNACEGNLVMGIDKCGNKIKVVEDCNDDNECTVDGCTSGACVHTPILVAPCGCASSSTVVCDANTLVTKDACGNVTGTVSCNDGDPCTVDACDAEAGVCQHDDQCCDASHELATACQDGVLMFTDTCGNVLEVKELCDDGDECTTDSCVIDACVHEAPGGKYVSQLCSDEGDLMWVDGCGRISELAEDCDDGKDCTMDSCDAGLGACVHTPEPGDTVCCEPEVEKVCVDGDVYWRDSCANLGELVETCLDGDVCTIDSCSAGACVTTPAPLPECPPCEPHASTACLGDAVVWVDGCDTLGEIIASCDDSDPCTIDTCDAKSAKCVHIPTDGCTPACAATASPICADGHLMWVDSCGKPQGLATNCEDGNPCTVDGCPTGGDACTHVPAESKECGCGAPAKTFCNGSDIVWLDGCGEEVALAMACDDDDPCTDDGCNVVTTMCEYTPGSDCPGPDEDLGPVVNPEADEPGEDVSVGTDAGDDGADVASPGDDLGAPPEEDVRGQIGDVASVGGDDLSPSIFVSGGGDSGCTVGRPAAPWAAGLMLLLGGLARMIRRRIR